MTLSETWMTSFIQWFSRSSCSLAFARCFCNNSCCFHIAWEFRYGGEQYLLARLFVYSSNVICFLSVHVSICWFTFLPSVDSNISTPDSILRTRDFVLNMPQQFTLATNCWFYTDNLSGNMCLVCFFQELEFQCRVCCRGLLYLSYDVDFITNVCFWISHGTPHSNYRLSGLPSLIICNCINGTDCLSFRYKSK